MIKRLINARGLEWTVALICIGVSPLLIINAEEDYEKESNYYMQDPFDYYGFEWCNADLEFPDYEEEDEDE